MDSTIKLLVKLSTSVYYDQLKVFEILYSKYFLPCPKPLIFFLFWVY